MGESRPTAGERPAESAAAGATGPSNGSPTGAVPANTSIPTSSSKSAARPGVLVVASNRQGEGIYPSLQAAVSAAKSGNVVELDFDGRREERPLVLTNIDLTFRAAEGRRPVLLFRPAEADAVGYPRSMVVVAGGSLSITGLEIELEMPRKISADAWALFEILRAERLRLERTTLTIRNSGGARQTAFHPAVAFFDLKTPPGSDTMGIGATGTVTPPLVELENCVLRGEATCLRTSEFEPVRLVWNNGLLATSESLLLAQAVAGRGGSPVEWRSTCVG